MSRKTQREQARARSATYAAEQEAKARRAAAVRAEARRARDLAAEVEHRRLQATRDRLQKYASRVQRGGYCRHPQQDGHWGHHTADHHRGHQHNGVIPPRVIRPAGGRRTVSIGGTRGMLAAAMLLACVGGR